MGSLEHAPDSGAAGTAATRSGGALLAVCGLCGGAGASTLAYLVARDAGERGEGPVLVCDTGGPTGGLAAYAGVASPRSLPAVADALARGEPLDEGLFADAGDDLRLIASGPDFDAEGDPRAIACLLHDAREAHPLTVVDCGTAARPADRHVLAAATHLAWILPATESGVRRAERVLAALPTSAPPVELVVARSDPAGRTPPLAELGALAALRLAPLVLMPHVPDLAERAPDDALEHAAVTLQAIEGVLAR
jgi:Flp pilus assembly CpaE family ATPase